MAIFTVCVESNVRDEINYTVDTSRPFGGYEPGDLICSCQPFHGIPLALEIAIRKDGNLIFRAWRWVDWDGYGNPYLHTEEVAESDNPFVHPFVPTQEQSGTVAGLVSGRIKFDGLTIAVGKTVLDVTKPDFDAEEQRLGRKIYFA